MYQIHDDPHAENEQKVKCHKKIIHDIQGDCHLVYTDLLLCRFIIYLFVTFFQKSSDGGHLNKTNGLNNIKKRLILAACNLLQIFVKLCQLFRNFSHCKGFYHAKYYNCNG